MVSRIVMQLLPCADGELGDVGKEGVEVGGRRESGGLLGKG